MENYESLKHSIDKLIDTIDKLNNKLDEAIEIENKNKYCLAVPTVIKPKIRGTRVRMR